MTRKTDNDKLHHLSRDSRGRWEMRVTIDQGKQIVGKPIRVSLGKCSDKEAIRRRDVCLKSLKKAGVAPMLRKQKRNYRRSTK